MQEKEAHADDSNVAAKKTEAPSKKEKIKIANVNKVNNDKKHQL